MSSRDHLELPGPRDEKGEGGIRFGRTSLNAANVFDAAVRWGCRPRRTGARRRKRGHRLARPMPDPDRFAWIIRLVTKQSSVEACGDDEQHECRPFAVGERGARDPVLLSEVVVQALHEGAALTDELVQELLLKSILDRQPLPSRKLPRQVDSPEVETGLLPVSRTPC